VQRGIRVQDLQGFPARKRKVAGDDTGAGPKLRFQFIGHALHHIGEEIAENDIRLIESGFPEIGITDFNPLHSECPEPGHEVGKTVHLETKCPYAIAPPGTAKDPSVSAADIHKKVSGIHGTSVEKGLHPDGRRGVKHGAAGDGKDRHDGGGEQELDGDETPDQNESEKNPGWHGFS